MLVSSAQLTDAAAVVRRRKRPQKIAAEGVTVTAAQLDTAARLLREAEPSVCNGIRAERPGFIDGKRQEGSEALVFELGILPSTRFLIGRRGQLLSEHPSRQRSTRQPRSCQRRNPTSVPESER